MQATLNIATTKYQSSSSPHSEIYKTIVRSALQVLY